MSRLSALLFITFFALLSSVGAPHTAAQLITGSDVGLGGQNRVTGMVIAPDGQRIGGRIAVKLVTQSRGDRVAMTDDNGNFAFTGLGNGDYTLVIDKEKDLEPYAYPFTIRQRRGFPAESVLVSIRLNYKKEVSYRPAVVNARFLNIPKNAVELYNKGVELGKKGDRKAAIEQLQKAIAGYDKFVDAYNEMGVQYLKLGESGRATEAFQAALRVDQNAYEPMMNLGMTLFLIKKYPEADPVIRAAVAMKEDHAVPHYFLGQNSAYLGKFDEAEKELLRAIELGGPEVVEAHRLLAIMYGSRGEKNKAANQLEAYLKRNPKAPDAEALRKRIAQFRQ